MTYDCIIVGAGSAGAVLAARLSENPAITVLLLEAGPDYASRAETPADLLDSRNLAGMRHDWSYVATAVDGRTIPYRRGKVTGGTSAINAAGAQWGKPADFAGWARLGNSEWTWDKVRPFFTKLESDLSGSGDAHGKNGPITISRYARDEFILIQRAFYEACLANGFQDVRDHNGEQVGGVGPWPMNREGSIRISTAQGYLAAARSRRNLVIRPDSLVARVRFAGKRAIGVELSNGEVTLAGSVVLCAGAVGSPAVLLRSGIGPAGDLQTMGTKVAVDLPGVGSRLQDHATVPIYLVPKPGQCVPGRDPRFQVMAQFTAEDSPELDDMQLVMVTFQDITGTPELHSAARVPVVAALRVALMRPRSYGRLYLTSLDPTDQPRIDLNFVAESEDMRRLLLGTRLAWKVASSEPIGLQTQRVVGISKEIVRSGNLLRDYVRSNVGTYCHAVGTVRMGPDHDKGAVVDQYCRVRGVEGLSVVDASVMPTITRAAPNLTVMMLGERVATWLSGGDNPSEPG